MMEEARRLWQLFDKYKETAEQHEFVRLLMLDTKLVPAWNDLQKNPHEGHAEIFVRVMKQVLDSLGVKHDS